LKTKKQDISLTDLFRKKLENAEIVPDTSVSPKLMRKLGRQEFLRFSPARFNIYYFGGILVIAGIAVLILSSGPVISDQLIRLNISGEINKGNTNVISQKSEIRKSDTLDYRILVPLKNEPGVRRKAMPVEDSVQNTGFRVNDSVTHTGVSASLNRKSLFIRESTEKDKLQGWFRHDSVLFEISASEGCTPLKLHFYNKSNSFDSCRWTFGDGGYSNEKNPDWIFDVEGEYNVVLNVFFSNGLHETSSTVITVYPKPSARFEIASVKAVLPEDEILFYNYSTNAIHFKWDFGDGNTSELFEPTHRYKKSGNYNIRLEVSSDYGCSDSLIVMNAFSGSEYFIDFPNAFIPASQGPTGGYYSPASDESAQVFHPVFSGVSDYQLKIFSRLGILIFESYDINIGWDGYIKGQLSAPGVYIWKVRGNFRNGEPFVKMGDVTVLKIHD
jgi:PKD repeat protein